MHLVVCIDEQYGISFLGKRQSQDRLLRQDLLAFIGEKPLWMAPCSARQFAGAAANIQVAEDFLCRAEEDEYAFTEGPLPGEKVQDIILYRWNRHYPADTFFPMALLEGRSLVSTVEFPGSSHDVITREVYSLGKKEKHQ